MNNRKTIITIGMFDGIHVGHRHLLDRLSELAKELDMKQAVFSFTDHPLSIICPERAPKLLMSAEHKFGLLSTPDRDAYIMECDENLLGMTALDFILYLNKNIVNVHAVLLGFNSTFGSDQPTPEQLREQLAKHGISLFVCNKYDKTEVSSSFIRSEIEKGNLDAAKQMTGRFLSVEGRVVFGLQKGTELGYPTANIEANERMIVPGPGVYAGLCKGHPAMINIGSAPTIRHDGKVTIEVHIIDFNENLYGSDLEVLFVERLRDEQKFDSLEALKTQLSKDRQAAIDASERLQNTQISKNGC